MRNKLLQIGKSVWEMLSRHTVLKLLSVVFAIMLWSYVISSNPAITRTKTIGDITGYVSGQETLEAYKLALLTDTTAALSDITVQVEVPQSSYTQVTADNVQVTLDISSVRTAGTQEVPLRATSRYGKVVNIFPPSLTLTFEPIDARSVPVIVKLTGGEDNGYWYNNSYKNPQQITVTGATSLVQSVSSAYVQLDVTDRRESFLTPEAFTLVDSYGAEVPQTMLNRSASSITVGVDVYPTKELDISTAVDDVLLGQVADGYRIVSVSVQPESVTVAAEKELLDALDKLIIQPIEIDLPTQSFTKRATISGLTDFKYISSEQVYVTVQIAEETLGAWIEDVYINFIGKSETLSLTYQNNTISIYATGPRSKVEALVRDGLTATVDLAGLDAGNYVLPILINEENYPGITFELEADTVNVTLVQRATDE